MMQPVQSVLFRPLQTRFLDIPQAPLCYWLRERFLNCWQTELLAMSLMYAKVLLRLMTLDSFE